MTAQSKQKPDRLAHPRAPLSRRAFLIRGVAVAGGAIALPVLSQEPASCSERALGSGAPTTSGVLATVDQGDLKDVTDSIMCEGGCGKTVYVGELTDACSIAAKMKLQAATYLAQGMTPPQVLDQFAADFGEGVLAAPTKSGVNLLAWLVPLVGLGVGGATVAAALTNGRRVQASIGQVAPETDPTMLSRIEDEVGKET